MRLEGDTSDIKNCGEFINITLPNHYLRRPISVCDYSDKHVDILFKILGHGTKDMSEFEVGNKLKCLIGLGNGFDIKDNIKPVLIAGGIGIAPFMAVIKKYNSLGIRPALFLRSHNEH